jgi:hypothetical protein
MNKKFELIKDDFIEIGVTKLYQISGKNIFKGVF